jgi:hypothetical protein
MFEEQAAVRTPNAGVRHAEVSRLSAGGLSCFYSEMSGTAAETAAKVKEEALEFFAVVQHAFAQAEVIPFRYPTLLKDQAELSAFLEERSGEYVAALQRLRGTAQMEVRITPVEKRPAASTGKQYLETSQASEAALEKAAAAAHAAAKSWLRDWRVRESASGLRCYALVARGELKDFEKQIHKLDAGSKVSVVVSGPWPPTEFVDVED